MRWIRTAACFTGALALMWALLPSSAVAAERATGASVYEAPVTIDASVEPKAEEVVSVVVPSSVSIAIQTNVISGRFVGFHSEPSLITNNAQSTAAIRIELTSVKDGTGGARKLLHYTTLDLIGQHTISVVEGEGQQEVVFDSLAPGTSEPLSINLLPKTDTVLIPNNTYALGSTLRVVAL